MQMGARLVQVEICTLDNRVTVRSIPNPGLQPIRGVLRPGKQGRLVPCVWSLEGRRVPEQKPHLFAPWTAPLSDRRQLVQDSLDRDAPFVLDGVLYHESDLTPSTQMQVADHIQ